MRGGRIRKRYYQRSQSSRRQSQSRSASRNRKKSRNQKKNKRRTIRGGDNTKVSSYLSSPIVQQQQQQYQINKPQQQFQPENTFSNAYWERVHSTPYPDDTDFEKERNQLVYLKNFVRPNSNINKVFQNLLDSTIQRQMNFDITKIDEEIIRIDNRINILGEKAEWMINKIQEIKSNIILECKKQGDMSLPKQALNLVRRHCLQNHELNNDLDRAIEEYNNIVEAIMNMENRKESLRLLQQYLNNSQGK
jgi:hypothetical protein